MHEKRTQSKRHEAAHYLHNGHSVKTKYMYIRSVLVWQLS